MALIFQLFLIWEGKTHASCKDLQIGKAVLQIGGENLKSGMWTLEHSSMELQKKKKKKRMCPSSWKGGQGRREKQLSRAWSLITSTGTILEAQHLLLTPMLLVLRPDHC